MAKKNREKSETPATEEAAAPAAEVTTTEPQVDKGATLVVPESPVAIFGFHQRKLAKVVEELPAEQKEVFVALLESLDPNKPGFEEMGGAQLYIPIVKVRHPITQTAPKNCELGHFFTDAGDSLGPTIEIIPLYMHYSSARFREGAGAPDCVSLDGVMSTEGQLCAECMDRPFRDGKPTDCQKGLDIYAFTRDLANLFHIPFAKTSFRAGARLYRQASRSKVPWDKLFEVSTESVKGASGNYFIMATMPTGEKLTNELHREIADTFYNLIKDIREFFKKQQQTRMGQASEMVKNLDVGSSEADDEDAGPEPDFSGSM